MEEKLYLDILKNNGVKDVQNFKVIKNNYKSVILSDYQSSVIKVYLQPDRKKNAYNEYNILNCLKDSKLHVPMVDFICTHEDLTIIKTEYIHGNTMTSKMFENPLQFSKEMREYFKILNALYEESYESYPFLNVVEIQDHINDICKSIVDVVGKCDPVIKQAYEYIQSLDYRKIAKNHLHLIHGDLHFDNIIENDKGYYLIDWEEAMISDPLIEFANIVVAYDEKTRNVLETTLKRKNIYNTEGLSDLMLVCALHHYCDYIDYYHDNLMQDATKYRFQNYFKYICEFLSK